MFNHQMLELRGIYILGSKVGFSNSSLPTTITLQHWKILAQAIFSISSLMVFVVHFLQGGKWIWPHEMLKLYYMTDF